ncbi:hypothetical protein ACMD2_24587 [Ananas comosus]|uniref:Uncharacterized protein n=1 Tax=Ananas comosus TaxID=4615 RepID=A0A199W649_ANACO|nr:hypothetical protein ACMD2_24587 [Ananas comosus]
MARLATMEAVVPHLRTFGHPVCLPTNHTGSTASSLTARGCTPRRLLSARMFWWLLAEGRATTRPGMGTLPVARSLRGLLCSSNLGRLALDDEGSGSRVVTIQPLFRKRTLLAVDQTASVREMRRVSGDQCNMLNDQPSATSRPSCPPQGPIDRMGHHVTESTNQVIDTTKENQPTRSQISYAEEIYSTPIQDTEHGNNRVE